MITLSSRSRKLTQTVDVNGPKRLGANLTGCPRENRGRTTDRGVLRNLTGNSPTGRAREYLSREIFNPLHHGLAGDRLRRLRVLAKRFISDSVVAYRSGFGPRVTLTADKGDALILHRGGGGDGGVRQRRSYRTQRGAASPRNLYENPHSKYQGKNECRGTDNPKSLIAHASFVDPNRRPSLLAAWPSGVATVHARRISD